MTALTLALLVVAAAFFLRFRAERGRSADLHRRIEELERRLEASNEAGERFLQGITHELRTPLAAILGYQELLADGIYGPLDPRGQEPVQRIGRAAHQLGYLIDGLLELAGPETGSGRLAIAPVAIRDVLERASKEAGDAAAERAVTVDFDVAGTLPLLLTDGERLHRILDLMLTAVIRASPGAALRLTAAPDDGGSAVNVELQGGAAILASVPPERFFEDATSDDGSQVVGKRSLRLAIAARMIRSLGGRLEVTRDDDSATLRLVIRGSTPPASAAASSD